MKGLKFFILMFVLSVFGYNAKAFDVHFQGTVIDGTGTPVPFAYLELMSLQDTLWWNAETDSNGVYDFTITISDDMIGDFLLSAWGYCDEPADTVFFIDGAGDYTIDFLVCEYEEISDECVPYFSFDLNVVDSPYYAYFLADDPNFMDNFDSATIYFGNGISADFFGETDYVYNYEGVYNVVVEAYSNICYEWYSFEQELYVYPMPDSIECFSDFYYFYADTTFLNAFFVNYSYGNILQSHWFFGDGTDTIVGPADTVVFHQYAESDEYWVGLEIETEQGCVDYWEQPVWMGDPDTLWFDYDDCEALFFTNYLPNRTVEFVDISWGGNGNITQYYWDFGDSTFSVEPNPVHVYQDTGLYLVTLDIQTESGCSSTFMEYVYISDDYDTSGYVLFYPDEGDSTGKGVTVNFHNLSRGEGDWVWNFGDSKSIYTTKSKNIVTHEYNPGTYKVKLIDNNTGTGYAMDIRVTNSGTVNVLKGYALRGQGASDIKQTVTSNNVTIFPNPVADYLNVVSEDANITKLEIFTIGGQLVKESNQTGKRISIDTRELLNGVYILKVYTDKGESWLKIVK